MDGEKGGSDGKERPRGRRGEIEKGGKGFLF